MEKHLITIFRSSNLAHPLRCSIVWSFKYVEQRCNLYRRITSFSFYWPSVSAECDTIENLCSLLVLSNQSFETVSFVIILHSISRNLQNIPVSSRVELDQLRVRNMHLYWLSCRLENHRSVGTICQNTQTMMYESNSTEYRHYNRFFHFFQEFSILNNHLRDQNTNHSNCMHTRYYQHSITINEFDVLY